MPEYATRMDELEARFGEIALRMTAISEAPETEDVDALSTELEALKEERAALTAEKAEMIASKEKRAKLLADIAAEKIPGKTTETAPTERKENKAMSEKAIGKYANDEYRSAFMKYVLSGTPMEQRIDATAATTDVTNIIPTTIMSRVIEAAETYGQLYAKATKTNFRGGVAYPISSLKPTATWVSEGSLSDKQKMTVTSSVTFTYNKLQCRVAVTLEVDTVTLDSFETLIANGIARAMVKGIEASMVDGDGTGEMSGIIRETVPAGRIASLTAAQIGTFAAWAAIVGKVPQSYRQGASLVMTQTDWDTYIVGMVDANGQPVARTSVGIDGYPVERFLGLPAILVEANLDTFAAAANTDVIGFIVKLEDYVINSNLQMTMKKYFDESTDEWIHKATLIADGQLVDTNGLVLIKASK